MITPAQRWSHPGGVVDPLRSWLEHLTWFFASPTDKAATTPSGVDDVEANTPDFETFVHQTEYDIFTYLWRMTGDVETASDLSQETFLRAWQHYGKISHYAKPKAWLFRVATNLASSHRTQLIRRGTVLDDSGMSQLPDKSSTSAEHVAEQDYVRTVLLAIPSRLRAVLVLHDAYGFTCAEIASMLHISPSATKMRLCRGRDEFRARYVATEDC